MDNDAASGESKEAEATPAAEAKPSETGAKATEDTGAETNAE